MAIKRFFEFEKADTARLPIIIRDIGHTETQIHINRTNGWHLHQFIWVSGGEGVFCADGNTLYLSKGQGIFTRNSCSISYSPEGDSLATTWVTFMSGEGLLDYYGVESWFRFDVPDFMDDSVAQLSALCSTTPALSSRSALAYMWATELMEALFSHKLSRIEKIKRFMEQNYDKPVTLDEIADFIGMNKFALCKYYHNKTGETLMNTLTRVRIRHAKMLLRYGFDPVAQIARQCGYDSTSYFIKRFCEQTGYTPLQYRQNKYNEQS